MYGGQAIVVGKMQGDDMQGERGVRDFDFVLGSKVDGNGIFPSLELLIELANGVEQFSIRLSRRFDRIELLVNLGLYGGKDALSTEEVLSLIHI